ncbi:MAG: glycerophosphodiester phosphodiesterase family protein [Amylibacter sp.]
MLDAFKKAPLAHRTLHDVRGGRPENSTSGAKAAIAAGYGLEIDLQMSSDGVAVVFHDDILQRLTRHFGRVNDYTLAELTAMRLSHGDECIPTFSNFLKLVDGEVPLLVEVKDQDGALGVNTRGAEQAICADLKGYKGAVALMSFNPHSVANCAKFAPEIPRGLVTDPFLADDWPDVDAARLADLAGIPDYDRVGASFISHNVNDLDAAWLGALKAQGAAVFCWTVRSAKQEAKARRIVDNVTFEGYLP